MATEKRGADQRAIRILPASVECNFIFMFESSSSWRGLQMACHECFRNEFAGIFRQQIARESRRNFLGRENRRNVFADYGHRAVEELNRDSV